MSRLRARIWRREVRVGAEKVSRRLTGRREEPIVKIEVCLLKHGDVVRIWMFRVVMPDVIDHHMSSSSVVRIVLSLWFSRVETTSLCSGEIT